MRVRTAAFEAILRQPVGWFDMSTDHTAGALANRLAADCYTIKALTGERAGLAVSQIVVLVAGLYISFSASWQLTLSLFAVIPLIILPVVVQAKVVQQYSERATDAFVAAGQTASETLLQLRTIAAFGLEQRSVERFEAELRLPFAQDVRKGVALGLGTGCAQGVILFGAAFQYFIGASARSERAADGS
jgi:ATP-binding cassette subfamily B (MDR/TAP) protein 1